MNKSSIAINLKMTLRSYMNILTVAVCLIICLTSCGQSKNRKTGQEKVSQPTRIIQLDTSKTAIISFNKLGDYPFNNTYKQATLTQEDLNNIDSLLMVCVTDFNNSLDKEHKEWKIDLKKYNYRKQLIVVTNNKGEKEVWVNCFCNTWGSDNWKTKIMFVEDGGDCYFNFKINLATKKLYDLAVNGVA